MIQSRGFGKILTKMVIENLSLYRRIYNWIRFHNTVVIVSSNNVVIIH